MFKTVGTFQIGDVNFRVEISPDIAARGGILGAGSHVTVREASTGKLICGYQGPLSLARAKALTGQRLTAARYRNS